MNKDQNKIAAEFAAIVSKMSEAGINYQQAFNMAYDVDPDAWGDFETEFAMWEEVCKI